MMGEQLRRFRDAVLDRLGESSTWQGVGFLLALLGARWAAGMDWGGAAALGGTVSALIKSALPDNLKKGE